MIDEMANKQYRKTEEEKGGFDITEILVPPKKFAAFKIKRIIIDLLWLVLCSVFVIWLLLVLVFSFVPGTGICDEGTQGPLLVFSLLFLLMIGVIGGPGLICKAKELMVLLFVKKGYVFIDSISSCKEIKFIYVRGGGIGTYEVKTHHLTEICSYLTEKGFDIKDENLPPITTDSGLGCFDDLYIMPYKHGVVGIIIPYKPEK